MSNHDSFKQSVDPICKFCGHDLSHRFGDALVEFGSPLLPLNVKSEIDTNPGLRYICTNCLLIQDVPDNFNGKSEEPIFLSPFSLNWLMDVKWYSDRVFQKFGTQPEGMTVELLDHRAERVGNSDSPLVFFGQRTLNPLMEMYGRVDFLNCHAELAEVKDVGDFMNGLRLFLKPTGIAILDFRHLSPELLGGDFLSNCRAPIRHYSFTTVTKLLSLFEMQVFDVVPCEPEGSLRISVKHKSDESKRITTHVQVKFGAERDAGMSSVDYYEGLIGSLQLLNAR